jgi:hypothetical protein
LLMSRNHDPLSSMCAKMPPLDVPRSRRACACPLAHNPVRLNLITGAPCDLDRRSAGGVA